MGALLISGQQCCRHARVAGGVTDMPKSISGPGGTEAGGEDGGDALEGVPVELAGPGGVGGEGGLLDAVEDEAGGEARVEQFGKRSVEVVVGGGFAAHTHGFDRGLVDVVGRLD